MNYKILKNYEKYFKSQNQKIENFMLVCCIITPTREKALSIMKEKEKYKIYDSNEKIIWFFDNEKWFWFRKNAFYSGFRINKIIIDKNVSCTDFEDYILPNCIGYCFYMKII